MSESISINYTGSPGLLTHPLYVKWSQKTVGETVGDLAGLKQDLTPIIVNQENLAIIAYLSTLIRVFQLMAVT
jgi:hypothetical protein